MDMSFWEIPDENDYNDNDIRRPNNNNNMNTMDNQFHFHDARGILNLPAAEQQQQQQIVVADLLDLGFECEEEGMLLPSPPPVVVDAEEDMDVLRLSECGTETGAESGEAASSASPITISSVSASSPDDGGGGAEEEEEEEDPSQQLKRRLEKVCRELTFTLGSKAGGYSDVSELTTDFLYAFYCLFSCLAIKTRARTRITRTFNTECGFFVATIRIIHILRTRILNAGRILRIECAEPHAGRVKIRCNCTLTIQSITL